MIKVYPNRLTETDPEVYQIDGNPMLLAWLYAQGMPQGADIASLPMTVWCGETQVLPDEWANFPINCDLSIYREPKGTDPFSITFALVFGAKAVLSALMPKIPGIQSQSNGPAGDPISEASIKGNKVKINDVIPELFGINRRYPDYAVLARRYFTEPRAQWLETLLVVGVGEYLIEPETVKSGETPLLSLGEDAEFVIYQPGADLTAESARMYWYSAPEVGQGSTGAAGLELTVTSNVTRSVDASVYQYTNRTLSIPAGAGVFPADWSVGLLINVGDPYAYTVSDGTGIGGRDVISGGNLANLGFIVGEPIEIRGDNPGFYEVFSITSTELQLNYRGGSPAVGLTVGNVVMAIGYVGLRYRIVSYSAQSLTLDRIDSSGDVDSDWLGWTTNQTNSGVVQLDASNLEGGYRGPFPACPKGKLVTVVEYSIFFPSGLVFLDAKGSYLELVAYHQIEFRDADLGGTWTEVVNTASGNDLDAKGFTYRINMPYPMRPELRIKKIYTDQGSADPEKEFVDTMMWYSLYGYIPDSSPVSYTGVTTIAVRVRGGDRISSQTEALLNLECTRILPVLNGSAEWNAPAPTRQISAAVGYIAKNVGYTDAELDLFELQRLENTWTARGDWYDKMVTSVSTVKAALAEVLEAGFGELTLDRGVIVPVRDEPRGTTYEHIYDPMNMTEPLTRDGVQVQPDDFDGVDVEYFDHTTWATETVQCRLPGDAGTRVEKVKVEGVTNRDRAWRIGMRRRAIQVYRNMTFSFATELDALNSTYLDYVALGDQVIGYGQSAFMKSWIKLGDRYLIGVSETFDWSVGGDFKLSIRRKDGKIAGPYNVTKVNDRTVSIDAFDFDNDPRSFQIDLYGVYEPPFLRFGPSNRWAYPALVTAVNPSGTKACKAEAVIYDERVYTNDNGFADN